MALPSGRFHQLGLLRETMPETSDLLSLRLSSGLRELGYLEGRNLVITVLYASRHLQRLPELARELVRLGLDVIVAVWPLPIQAAKDATTTIPIMMFRGGDDPIAAGFVTNLARPGGNITGALIAPSITLVDKQLELLKLAVPRATRIAFLSLDSKGASGQVPAARKTAAALNIALMVAEVQGGNFDRAFEKLVAERPAAVLIANSRTFFRQRRQIIDLAAKHRLPAMYKWEEQVEDGGLISYGSSQSWVTQRVAAYATPPRSS